MSSNYYYIYSFLPEISFNETEDYGRFSYLFDEIMELLSEEDSSFVKYIRYPIDNTNLVSMLEKNGRNFLSGGNYTQQELLHIIKSRDVSSPYMSIFLEEFRSSQDESIKLGNINYLNTLFYEEALALENNLLKRWFVFERDLNNVLTALECRKHNEPIERREVPRMDQRPGQRLTGDYEVTEQLLHSKSLDYSLSGTLAWITRVLDFNSSNPARYERDIILLKLDMLDELAGDDIFTMDMILAYLIKLQVLIRWSRLDKDKGRELIDTISKQTDRRVMEAFAY